MLTLKDILVHHLEHTFEKEAWQPSLLLSLEGLSAVQASWKPSPERHSIWQIIRHVARWKQATLEAWDGTKPLYRAGYGETEYARELERSDWQDVKGDERTWRADLEALRVVSMQLKRRVAAMDDHALLAPFEGEDMPIVLRLIRMATHDIYHAGQVRCLRALQGAGKVGP